MASSLPRLRSVTVSTKVSEEEYAQLEKQAEARGVTVSEWCREALLATVEKPPASPAEGTILAEVLGLRMLYLNTVQILGQGRELGTEELRKLIERVDREKQAKAEARLAGKDGQRPGAEK
jgi:hypothetical protein